MMVLIDCRLDESTRMVLDVGARLAKIGDRLKEQISMRATT